jgi:hypothetical protein
MLDKQVLFGITECRINGSSKETKGKVLAVANYADRQMVCFCIEGEKIGKWIPITDLILTEKDQSNNKISQEPKSSIKEKIQQGQKIPTNDWQQKISKLIGDYSSEQFDKHQVAVSEVNSNNPTFTKESLVDELINISINKAIHDFAGEIRIKDFDNFEKFLKALASYYVSLENNSDTDQNLSNVLKNIQNTIEAIPSEILSAINVGRYLIDISSNTSLLVELVYKVGCVYGFDHRSDKAEFAKVLGIALSSSIISTIGVAATEHNTPIPKKLIAIVSNIVTLSTVGHTANYYYQYQNSTKFEDLVSKLQMYIENNLFQRKVMEMLTSQP